MSELFMWLKQPSTIRGLVQAATLVGITVSPANLITWVTAGGGLVALINLVKKDVSKW
jgi:hypothetical protein